MAASERSGAHEVSLARACAILGAALVALAALGRLAGLRLTTLLPGLSDLTSYFLPKYEFAAARVREGALPLWNPYELLGLPFLATMQPGVLYPPLRAAYLAFDGDAAYLALLVLHLGIGAFLSLLLARSLGLSIGPCVLASGWVILPTWLIRVGEHPIYFEAVAWIPGLLLLARRVVLAPSARAVALLALAAAMLVLSGYPPFALAAGYALLLGLPFWLVELGRTRPGATRGALALSAAALLAAALCAAQILPTAAWLPESQRAEMMSGWREIPASALPPDLAYLLGLPEETLAGALRDVWLEFGPALLALAALSPCRRGLGATAAFAAALATVATLVPFGALRRLPLYGQVRFGLEWTFLAPIPVFLLAGIGLDALLRRARSSRTAALALAVGALATTGAWNQGRIPERWRAPRPPRVAELPAGVAEHCDLRPGHYRYFWPLPAAHGAPLASRTASISGVEQSIPPARSARLAARIGVETYLAWDWLRGFQSHPGLLRRMALRCVISDGPLPALEAAGFRRVPRGAAGGELYRRDDALPRVRMAFEAVAAGSPEEALALAGDTRLDAERAVILEGVEAPPPAPCAEPRAGIEILRYDEEAIAVRVDAACAGWLVVADTHASGWTARVDGAPAPVLRADYAFRAVALDRGRHELQMEYRPASVRWGLRISLLAALALVALLGLPAARDPFRRR